MIFVILMAGLAVFEVSQGNLVLAAAFAALALNALMPVLEGSRTGKVASGLWGPRLSGYRGTVSALSMLAAFGLVGYYAINQ